MYVLKRIERERKRERETYLIILIIRPVLYLLHDLLVSGLHLAVVCPLGREDLLVAGELGGPAQVEAGHDHGQVVRLDQLVVGSNLDHLQTRGE